MLKIGVVGAGHLGKIHIKILKNVDFVELIGFYDIDDDVSSQVENEIKIKAYDSLNDLIEHCDVLDIVTPTINHYETAQTALKKSKHVFIEKPVTHTLKEVRDLIKLSEEAAVKAQVGHVERFNPAYSNAKKLISKPKFIETHRLATFNPRGTDVSVVLDLMIHDLDILLSINKGNSIKKIHATGASVVTDFIDLANARIEFEDGLVANLTASRISSKQMRKIRIFQDKSYIGIDLSEKKLDVYKINNDKDNFIDVKSIDVEEGDALEGELSHFIDCIINNDMPLVSANDGIDALKLAVKIEELIKEGRLI